MTVGIPFDDEPTVNSQDESAGATSGSHNLRRRSNGECNHEITGSRLRRDKLPYQAFRRVNAERGDGEPSPYDDKDAVNSSRLRLIRSA